MKRVDSLGLDDGGQHHGWRVVVTGTGDHSGQSRVYELREETQDDAAMEGIRRFEAFLDGIDQRNRGLRKP